MTALADKIRRTIRLTGPITIADYMAAALSDPDHGYYAGVLGRAPIGAGGDFVTAPEVSQMFGELIGLWCADRWHAMGAPDPVRLVELGPGRGTLLSDALRAGRTVPGFAEAIDLHLVETSRALRDVQSAVLSDSQPHWHDDLTSVPDGPILLVANEFFDALPIHQYVGTEAGWRERLIRELPDGGLSFCDAPGPTTAAAIMHVLGGPPTAGDVAEISPAAISLASMIGARVARMPGAALVVDYGRSGMIGDSFQAVGQHQFRDVLDAPGTIDLSAHVDFSAISRAAGEAGAAVHGPITQGAFLAQLGIETRAATLLRAATPTQAQAIKTALHRLTAPDEMGDLFKALAVVSPDQDEPPGFVA